MTISCDNIINRNTHVMQISPFPSPVINIPLGENMKAITLGLEKYDNSKK